MSLDYNSIVISRCLESMLGLFLDYLTMSVLEPLRGDVPLLIPVYIFTYILSYIFTLYLTSGHTTFHVLYD